MKQIYTHGLGQTAASWNGVVAEGNGRGNSLCPELAELVRGKEVNYHNLYQAFADVCDRCEGMVDLCGLSLGGVLSLHYAIDHPQKVHSLILIATQYKMPKRLLQFQNMLFRFMPKATFAQMGFGKADFIRLCKTMADLDFSASLAQVSCRTLVLCGEKDAANQQASVALAKGLPHAKLHLMQGLGHEINTEAPKILAKECRDFFGE